MRGYLWYPDTRGNTSLRISPCVFMRFSDTERSYLQNTSRRWWFIRSSMKQYKLILEILQNHLPLRNGERRKQTDLSGKNSFKICM